MRNGHARPTRARAKYLQPALPNRLTPEQVSDRLRDVRRDPRGDRPRVDGDLRNCSCGAQVFEPSGQADSCPACGRAAA